MIQVFMASTKKLFQPLAYLRIKHKEKLCYDWFLPIMASVFSTVVCYKGSANLVSMPGVIPAVCDLQKILIGFYIASLAAVANFHGDGLDKVLAGEPATIQEMNDDSTTREVKLTRRRFLCYLFGYLAFLSFVLYCVGTSIQVLHPKMGPILWRHGWFLWLRYGVCFVYMVAFFQLIFTTFLGLYYMSYRIHVLEPKDPTCG